MADRRAAMARALAESGDVEAGLSVMEQALELAPDWSEGWALLGDMRAEAGATQAAVAAHARALSLAADDRYGSGVKLALLGAAPPPDHLPGEFVEAVFDEASATFDRKLLDGLNYRGPEAFGATLARDGRRYRRALDLGCGTGLVGAVARGLVDRLEGVDLSARMLAKARGRGCYDGLHKADAVTFLAGQVGVELILAADMVNYLGTLEPLMAATGRALIPGGRLILSIETLIGGGTSSADGMRLHRGLRFAHAPDYVLRVAMLADLVLVDRRDFVLREEAGRPVPATLFTFEKEPAAALDTLTPLASRRPGSSSGEKPRG